jgi:hypothetical protein
MIKKDKSSQISDELSYLLRILEEISLNISEIEKLAIEVSIKENLMRSIKKRCLKLLFNIKKILKKYTNANISSLEKLRNLGESLPSNVNFKGILNEDLDTIELLSQDMIKKILSDENGVQSLRNFVSKHKFSFNEIIPLCRYIKEKINNIKIQINKVQSAYLSRSSKTNVFLFTANKSYLDLDLRKYLPLSNYYFLFDTNFLINLEDLRHSLRKDLIKIVFPNNSRIIIFPNSFNESRRNPFLKNMLGNSQKLFSYIANLENSQEIEPIGNLKLRDQIINLYSYLLENEEIKKGGNIRDSIDKFRNSLDLDILEYALSHRDKNIVILSDDKDIRLILFELAKKINTSKIRILSYEDISQEYLKKAA